MLYQRIKFRSERVVLQTVTELYAYFHTEVRTSKASEFLREEFPEELSEYDRHLTPSAILTPDIRKRNPAFLPVPMPKRQVRYGPYCLMERSPMVRPQYIPQSGLVDVEHQLARLPLQVLCVETKRGVTTRIRKFYMRLPSGFWVMCFELYALALDVMHLL